MLLVYNFCKGQKDTFCKRQKDAIYKRQIDTLKALYKISLRLFKRLRRSVGMNITQTFGY